MPPRNSAEASTSEATEAEATEAGGTPCRGGIPRRGFGQKNDALGCDLEGSNVLSAASATVPMPLPEAPNGWSRRCVRPPL